jgi:hypothetical protein
MKKDDPARFDFQGMVAMPELEATFEDIKKLVLTAVDMHRRPHARRNNALDQRHHSASLPGVALDRHLNAENVELLRLLGFREG